MLFHKILFPVDYSEPCERVVPSVAAMRQAMGAGLTLLHSIDLPSDWPTHEGVNHWINNEALRACDHGRLCRFGTSHFDGSHPEIIQESGDPAAAILHCVKADNIDLVMMPTHGYGFFRRTLLGSVTTKVLHDARCAVWTASHGDAIPGPEYRHILCAVAEPTQDTELLRSASGLALTFGASLSIVYAYPDFAGTPEERYERAIPKHAEGSIRHNLEALQVSAGTSVPVVIAGGEVNEVIAETARRQEADLVVTGRGTFGGFLLSIRSHLYDIIRFSPCPVLVLPDDEHNPHNE
jgi:nucleotide-binding universal stress UspA family protein